MKTYSTLIFILLLNFNSLCQLPFLEDFENGSSAFSTSITQSTDGSKDYFTISNGSNISSSITFSGTTGNFFCAQDIDSAPSNSGSTATLTFANIDITGCNNLSLQLDIAEDDDGNKQDWDNSDFFHVDASIDGNPTQNVIWVESSGNSNSAPSIDTDFNGSGDGTSITDTFESFSNVLNGTGSTLTITITIKLNSGDEDIAFDNLTIIGDCPTCPGLDIEPTTSPSALITTPIDCFSETLSWSLATDGSHTLIVMATSPITGFPTDGVSYAANSTYGLGDILNTGEFVISNSTTTTETISGLTENTTYYITAFSYNGTTANCQENYLIPGITYNFTTNTNCTPSNLGCMNGTMHVSGSNCGCLSGCDLTTLNGENCNSGTSGNCNQPTLITDINVPEGCTFTVLAEIKNRPNGCSSSGADNSDDLKVDVLGGNKIPINGTGNSNISDSYTLTGPGTIRITSNTNRADEIITYSTTFTGPFCVACASILPIELINFNAKKEDSYTHIKWTTASERNSDYFILEKSLNGFTFHPLQKIKASTNSTTIRDYDYNDYKEISGISYYRLKQVDLDGQSTYSYIIKVSHHLSTLFYNNNKIHIKYKSNPSLPHTLNIYNLSGQLVFSKKINGSESINWNKKGFYLVEIPEIQIHQKILAQ